MNSETLREMLEMAAKAAGYCVGFTYHSNTCLRVMPDGDQIVWNPLEDDGDRHRLLVGLHMTLAHEPNRGGWSVGAVVDGEFRWLAHDDDEALAVVRAAAEIGRARL